MIPLQTGVFDAAGAGVLFLVARILFGGVLAYMGIGHLTNADGLAPYAESKGIPAAGVLVPFSGGQLVLGGLAVVLGVFPTLGAGALLVFLVVSAVTMHDFWAAPDDQRGSELTAFQKNAALAGGALALLALSGVEWPYALGIGLF